MLSRTLTGQTTGACDWNAISPRSWSALYRSTGMSSIRILPAVGPNSHVINFSIVDLPAAVGAHNEDEFAREDVKQDVARCVVVASWVP